MTRRLLFGLIKLLMLSTPCLSIMMILALWGVVGKTTYTDLDPTRQDIAFGVTEAKNYLVNETKNIEQCPNELSTTDIATDIASKGENPMSKKIDWDHVV